MITHEFYLAEISALCLCLIVGWGDVPVTSACFMEALSQLFCVSVKITSCIRIGIENVEPPLGD